MKVGASDADSSGAGHFAFTQYDLGYVDDEVGSVEPIANPFGSTMLPMRSV